jgi:hypothetical protein
VALFFRGGLRFLAVLNSGGVLQQPATTSPPLGGCFLSLQNPSKPISATVCGSTGRRLHVGTPKDTEVSGLQEVNIEVKIEGNTEREVLSSA